MSTQTIIKPDQTIAITQEPEIADFFEEQRVLIVGQMLAGNAAVSGDLLVGITEDDDINALFGDRAIITQMVIAFLRINKETRLDVIPIGENILGDKAVGSIVFTGTATRNGSLTITVGSEFSNSITVDIVGGEDGDTAEEIAIKYETLFNEQLTNAPVEANSAGASIIFTSATTGTVGNLIGLEVFGAAEGVSVVINALTGGTTDPITSDIFSVVGELRYQTIAFAAQLDTSELVTFLDNRFNTENDVLDGVGILSIENDVASMITVGESFDSQSIVIFANPLNAAASHGFIFELPDVITAQFAASRALRLTFGANITKLLSGSTRGDTFGCPKMASRPYHNVPMPELSLIPSNEGLLISEVFDLGVAGLSFIGNNIARDSVVLSTVRTTEKNEPSFEFLNIVDTASQIREYFFNNFRAEYQQSRLTTGDLIEGRNMQNENSIRAFANQLYTNLSQNQFNLTVAGEEALKIFKEGTIISLDFTNGVFTMIFNTVPVTTQVRNIESVVQVEFVVTQSSA